MPRNNKATTTAAAPQPHDPAGLLAAALQAMAAGQPGTTLRLRVAAPQEQLSQPLTARDRAALERIGWTGRLSSGKPAEPKPRAAVKCGPIVRVATFGDLSPQRQASAQYWAGLCSTLSRSAGRVWLPEAAAVALQLGVEIASPAQLCARLAALTGCPVTRPADQAGWLVCQLPGEMDGADLWAQLWNAHLQRFTDAIAQEGSAD